MERYLADTFSLTSYAYEVDQLPHLTAEETVELGQRLLLANQGKIHWAEGMMVRDAIIQGHLHLVFSLAQRYPYDVREDLIQEGSIGLIEAVEHYRFCDERDFASYARVAIRHAFATAMESVLPIRIPRSSMRAAKARGTAPSFYAMQPISLDRPLHAETEASLADTLVAPASPESLGSLQEHIHASSVDALLETLPGMTRCVLELRYGLHENDQRSHSYTQIANTLGISKSVAHKLEQEGLHLLAGKHLRPEQLRQMAQESRLNAAYVLLQQSQQRISSRRLAKAAKVRGEAATAYLARIKHADTSSTHESHVLGEKTYTKLLYAYHRLVEQHDTVSVLALQKAAGVHWYTAKKFLEQRAAQGHPQQLEQIDVYREVVEA